MVKEVWHQEEMEEWLAVATEAEDGQEGRLRHERLRSVIRNVWTQPSSLGPPHRQGGGPTCPRGMNHGACASTVVTEAG